MTYRILFLLLLITSLTLRAQLDCKETFTMRVTAKSGLNMREQANANARVLTTIPYDNILIACASTSGKLTMGSTSGFWRQVSFEGKQGYVFDAYLELVDPALRKTIVKEESAISTEKTPVEGVETKEEKPEPAKIEIEKKEDPKPVKPKLAEKPAENEVKDYRLLLEAYNFCGAVKEIDPGILWYGFYPADPEQGENEMKVEPVELEIVLSKSRSSNDLEFDIRTGRAERSLFLIGTTSTLEIGKMNLEDRSQLLRYSNQKVFPGQQINVSCGKVIASLAATGGINSTGDCPELDNYQLMVNTGKSINLMELLPKDQCGLPEIYWFGDLNGDQLPDFIVVSIFKEQNVFTLLVSQKDDRMRKAAQWTIEKC